MITTGFMAHKGSASCRLSLPSPPVHSTNRGGRSLPSAEPLSALHPPEPAPPDIELRRVSKTFDTPGGGRYTAIRDLDLTVTPGEFCALVGPTGSGKSTTLTLVSGLEAPTE